MTIKNLILSAQNPMAVANSLHNAHPWRSLGAAGLLMWSTGSGASAVHAQKPDAVNSRSVLILSPYSKLEGERKLSPHLADAIVAGISARVGQTGYTPVRARPAEEASCPVANYECKIQASRQAIDWVVEVQVQVNPDGTYFFQNILYQAQHPDNTIHNDLPYGTPGSSRQLNPVAESALVAKVADRVADLFQQAAKAPQPAEVAPPHSPKLPPTLSLAVAVNGRGRVVSQPPGIDCPGGGHCGAAFGLTAQQGSILLTAEPTGAAGKVSWPGAHCKNPVTVDPNHCALTDSGNLKVTAEFERTNGRKIATGALGALAGAGLVTTAVLLGLTGHDAGGCTDGGKTYSSGCVYNFGPAALLTAGLAIGLGGGAALAWWLPTPKERKE